MDFCCFRIPEVARDRPPDAGADGVVVADTENVFESMFIVMSQIQTYLIMLLCRHHWHLNAK